MAFVYRLPARSFIKQGVADSITVCSRLLWQLTLNQWVRKRLHGIQKFTICNIIVNLGNIGAPITLYTSLFFPRVFSSHFCSGSIPWHLHDKWNYSEQFVVLNGWIRFSITHNQDREALGTFLIVTMKLWRLCVYHGQFILCIGPIADIPAHTKKPKRIHLIARGLYERSNYKTITHFIIRIGIRRFHTCARAETKCLITMH